jgi:hypothetical protein
MCERPVLHNGNQLEFQMEMPEDDHLHDGAVDRHVPAEHAGPKSCITFQAFMFERLLDKQLSKINKFFNRSHQEYIVTVHVS